MSDELGQAIRDLEAMLNEWLLDRPRSSERLRLAALDAREEGEEEVADALDALARLFEEEQS